MGNAAQTLGGAAQGAALGAKLGSVVPGIGNLAGGIVGGVGGLISGIFGGGEPEYNAPTMDAGTAMHIDKTRDAANRSIGDWEKINNEGLGDAKGFLPSEQKMQHQSAALGGTGSDIMSEAIANKSKKYFDADQQIAKTKGYEKAFGQRDQAEQTYNNLAQQQKQIEMAVKQKNYVNQMQYQASRNDTIKSMFQSAGSVFGQMAGDNAAKTQAGKDAAKNYYK